MIITISGLPGSGKSTVAKMVAEKLGCPHYSAGDIQRELAVEHGMDITKWGEYEKKDKKYDHMVDNKISELAEKHTYAVFDSWLAPHFVPDAVKIFLECDENIRAQRRVQHRRKTEKFDTIKETMQNMRERVQINRERWKEFYGYDFLDMANYDIIVDSTRDPETITAEIISFVQDLE